MKAKKKILLNWWYDRPDLMEPFVKLKDEIDFTLIFYKKRNGAEAEVDFPVIYWDDFTSPYELLKKVNPDEVIFINIDDAPYQIALNIACNEKGVRTFICDHGLRGVDNINSHKFSFAENKQKTLLFMLSCITRASYHLLPLLFLLVYYKLIGSAKGRVSSKFKILRLPTRYICYTNSAAKFFIERDGADLSQFTITGNPSFDKYFGDLNNKSGPSEYYLLIDQPFVGSRFNNNLLTLAEKNDFLLKLATFCHSQGKYLFVKLHPDNYGQDYFVRHPSIRYSEEEDLSILLRECEGVFGFYSTLLVPAIIFKTCIVFKINKIPIQSMWAELGVVKMLDFHSFKPEDLSFSDFIVSAEQKQKFVDLFIYKTDGNANERLKQALLSENK